MSRWSWGLEGQRFERSLKRSLAVITQSGGNNSSTESSDARVPGVRSKTARSSGWLEKARHASRLCLHRHSPMRILSCAKRARR